MKANILGGVVFSLLGILAQLLGSVVIFIIIARTLGPSEFGKFAIYFSIASVLAIILDYGYPQRLLREFHEDIKNYGGIRKRILHMKAVIFFFELFCACIVLFVIDGDYILFLTLFFSAVCFSFANVFSSCLKSVGKFRSDSVSLFSVYFTGFVCSILVYFSGISNVYVFSFILFLTNVGYFFLSVRSFSRFALINDEPFNVSNIVGEIKEGAVYAGDVFVQRAFIYIEILILSLLASAHVVGLYQAGQKLILGVLPLAQAFNNVLLPYMSKNKNYENIGKVVLLISVMLSIGLFGLAGFYFLGEWIVFVVYGEDYDDLKKFVLLFGIIVLIRYVSFSLSIILTSAGLQKVRLKANIASFLLFVFLAPLLVWGYSMDGMLYTVIISAFLSCIFYMQGVFNIRKRMAK